MNQVPTTPPYMFKKQIINNFSLQNLLKQVFLHFDRSEERIGITIGCELFFAVCEQHFYRIFCSDQKTTIKLFCCISYLLCAFWWEGNFQIFLVVFLGRLWRGISFISVGNDDKSPLTKNGIAILFKIRVYRNAIIICSITEYNSRRISWEVFKHFLRSATTGFFYIRIKPNKNVENVEQWGSLYPSINSSKIATQANNICTQYLRPY